MYAVPYHHDVTNSRGDFWGTRVPRDQSDVCVPVYADPCDRGDTQFRVYDEDGSLLVKVTHTLD
jgi:hypothetical protein